MLNAAQLSLMIALAPMIRAGMQRRGLDPENFEHFTAYMDFLRHNTPIPYGHEPDAEDRNAADAVEGRTGADAFADAVKRLTKSEFSLGGHTDELPQGPAGTISPGASTADYGFSPDNPREPDPDDALDNLCQRILEFDVDGVILSKRPPGFDGEVPFSISFNSEAIGTPAFEDLKNAVDGAKAAILTPGYQPGDARRALDGVSSAPVVDSSLEALRGKLSSTTLLRLGIMILNTLQAMTDDEDLEEIFGEVAEELREWSAKIDL